MTKPTAAIVIVGNEVLSGAVADENTPFLCRELRRLGLQVSRVAMVEDCQESIAAEIRNCSATHTYVFTAGGVGPTHDDVTIDAVSRAFGVRLAREPQIEAQLRKIYGKDANEYVLKMADVPEGATLHWKAGVQWPLLSYRNVYILPGVPQFVRSKLETFADLFRSDPFHKAVVHVSAPEAAIAAWLHSTVRAYPLIALGSYPVLNNPAYKVQLTLESKDLKLVHDALEHLLLELPKEIVVSAEAPP